MPSPLLGGGLALGSLVAPLAIAGPFGIAAGVGLGLAGSLIKGRKAPKPGTKNYAQAVHAAMKRATEQQAEKARSALKRSLKRGEITEAQELAGQVAVRTQVAQVRISEFLRYRSELAANRSQREARRGGNPPVTAPNPGFGSPRGTRGSAPVLENTLVPGGAPVAPAASAAQRTFVLERRVAPSRAYAVANVRPRVAPALAHRFGVVASA